MFFAPFEVTEHIERLTFTANFMFDNDVFIDYDWPVLVQIILIKLYESMQSAKIGYICDPSQVI